MNFDFTEEQEKLYGDALAFARAELRLAPGGGPAGREVWSRCGAFGLLGLCAPREWGGMGLDAQTTARVLEGVGRGAEDLGLAFSMAAHLFACVAPIMEHGTDAQKERCLPKLVTGEWIGANAITEAEAGSDAYALKTRAVRDGDRWRLTGSKSYVTNAPLADLFLVYATLNPAHGFMGVSGFLVWRENRGLTVGGPFEKMGLKGSPIAQIYLEACEVAEDDRLGPEGGGAAVFTRSMLWERGCLFALYVGAMDALLERTVAWARERKQFKQPIGKFQGISHAIAEMKLSLESARLLLYRACWAFDQGKDAMLEISMSKLAVSEAAVASALQAIQIHGGMGYVVETGIERVLRDAIPSTLFSGTSEIHRNIIAARLGL